MCKSNSAEEKALELFADMMLQKLETINQDWKKPWFNTSLSVPRNFDGRAYNGMNSVMLLLLCEMKGYKMPVFMTHAKVHSFNDGDKSKTLVQIRKGEKSFPVFLTVFNCVNKETKERIPYDDWRTMTEQQRDNYYVYPSMKVYNVFNIEQTNLQEARQEAYEKMINKLTGEDKIKATNEEVVILPSVDAMIKNNGWLCPIAEVPGDDAYYSISKDAIVIPERRQFKDAEAFQANLFHEMAHSTGASSRLDRLKGGSFGSKEYGIEELVAELTAAFVAQSCGFEKHIKEDSAPYLNSWLNSLHEDKTIIKSILQDVKRASHMITTRMAEVDRLLAEGKSVMYSNTAENVDEK